jgi:hypothetical protein
MDPVEANYDEDKVPQYKLPDPLITANGEAVTSAAVWTQTRRPEILQLFKTYVYGEMPDPLPTVHCSVTEQCIALDGRARRRQIRIRFTQDGPCMDLLLYLPATATGPVPTFLGLNFFGNHTIQPDPAIHLSTQWMQASPENGIVDHRATSDSRGIFTSRWPVETILARGYVLATAYCGYQNGVHPLFYKYNQHQPADNEWGAIGAWAWGLSRAMDYLQTDPAIDPARIPVLGLSRLGKTALWAGACDERFALVISNESGCGGAALSRRCYGETIARINKKFPHWFCNNFRDFNHREHELPID